MLLPLNNTDITLSFGSLVIKGGLACADYTIKWLIPENLNVSKETTRQKMLMNWVQ